MSRAPRTTFLEPRTYRSRRLQDAARVLPVVGAVLFLLPVLWVAGDGSAGTTSGGFIYLFVVWALLILVAALMARGLQRSEPQESEAGEDDA